jgi:hypothetical protein
MTTHLMLRLERGLTFFMENTGIFKSRARGLLCQGIAIGLLCFIPLGRLMGAPMEASLAKAAVSGWLKAERAPLETLLGQQVKRMETFGDGQGVPLYYIAYLDPEGFVIVAADDLIEPIIGFAPDGRYDPSADNPLGALVSSDLPGRVAKARSVRGVQALGQSQAAQTKWARLIGIEQGGGNATLGITSVSDVRVAPFVKSLWDQATEGGNACYNYYVPPAAEGTANNYPCGCVATAMAQLMRFWQYPKVGVGAKAFTIKVSGVSQSRNLRGGDGAGGAYVWSNMSLTNGSATTLAQRQAIGALCHDAGVSVGMDYDASGSSSDTLAAKTALVSTFKYANAVKGYNSSGNIGAGLNGMINPNLDAACPVVLGITGTPGGHAIICDGYGYTLSTLYHHLNLGWGGSNNAWYNLPTIDTYAGTFTSTYKCIYNVWTNGSGEIISGRVADSSGIPLAGVAVSATRSGGGSYAATSDARGIYAFARVPSASQYVVSATKAGYSFSAQSVSTGTSSDYAATSGNRWAINFSSFDAHDPSNFVATVASSSQINLSWAQNASQDSVMVAWSTNGATFGTPSGSYAAGAAISGGGTVLYNGSATNVSHTGLRSNATYAYKAWSVRGGPTYSSGLISSATTSAGGVPFAEGFEHEGSVPAGWTQEAVTGTALWTFEPGSDGHPASAHTGGYNALLYAESASDHKTKLVTPMLRFGLSPLNAQLTFWHYMKLWQFDQDELRVYCKTSAGGAWTLLASYTNNVAIWTQRTIPLPNVNDSYYIGFEGNAKYGYGVCIDDVAVTADSFAPESFDAWAQTYSPGVTAADAFAQDLDGDGVQNGFAYAFGSNLAAGAPLLNLLSVSGTPVVDVPKQLAATAPYVSVYLEMTRSLTPTAWTTNGIEPVQDAGEPANRDWYQPAALQTNALFRLRGVLR